MKRLLVVGIVSLIVASLSVPAAALDQLDPITIEGNWTLTLKCVNLLPNDGSGQVNPLCADVSPIAMSLDKPTIDKVYDNLNYFTMTGTIFDQPTVRAFGLIDTQRHVSLSIFVGYIGLTCDSLVSNDAQHMSGIMAGRTVNSEDGYSVQEIFGGICEFSRVQ